MTTVARPTLRAAAAVIVFALSFAPGADAQSTSSSVGSSKSPKLRIENFGKISEQYYRGEQPDPEDYADLAALGVKTIINLTSHDADAAEQGHVEKAGMHYVQIPMTTREPPTLEKMTEFLRVVGDPARQPVFVHCVGGKHRTGVMTAVYRMIRDSWTPDQAFKEMKRYKFGADFLHPEFKKFVLGFRPDIALTDLLQTEAVMPKTER